MKLILKPKDFKNLPNKSSYNDNVYHNDETYIRVVCDEDANDYTYFLKDVDDGRWVWLGCSADGLHSEKEEVEIDFQVWYT